MKNILNYFYQIIINEEIDDLGYFFYNNHLFLLEKYRRNPLEIDSLVILNNYMIMQNIMINQIVLNKDNKPLTFFNNEYYVLLKIDYREKNINFKTIEMPILNNIESLKRNNWNYLWSCKVDYIEYQIEHLEHRYPFLYETVNYYIGLSENAIMYFNMIDLSNEKLYINHRRINDIYNPLELVIDYKVRDLSEYIKKMFFIEGKTNEEILEYLYKLPLTNMDYVLLYIRLLYPSYYFDMYDNILRGKILEKEIKKITDYSTKYEKFLKEIFLYLNKYSNIIEISWIK